MGGGGPVDVGGDGGEEQTAACKMSTDFSDFLTSLFVRSKFR